MLSPLLIEQTVRAALLEDLTHGRDVTSELLIPGNAEAKAVMRARSAGVLAGLVPSLSAFSFTDPDFNYSVNAEDGEILTPGQEIATIEGPARALLTAERTALNFVTHLSGIASMTAAFVHEIDGTKAQITCTRKTIPGLRVFQKYAVRIGGGVNHRFGLGDMILIKDNHINVSKSIKDAIRNAKAGAGHSLKIEIEVDSLTQLDEVLKAGGVDLILLDNMDVKTLAKAVKTVDGKIPLEASGGVSLENVRAIAETGVDYIAVGALTHSAPALDIGLDIDV